MNYKEILEKIAQAKATEAEKARLLGWLDTLTVEEYQQVFEEYQSMIGEFDDHAPHHAAWLSRVHARIQKEEAEMVTGLKVAKRIVLYRWLAAASILLLLGTLAFFYIDRKLTAPELTQTRPGRTDIGPGHDGAILTLADGKQVVLDSAGNGIIAMQSGAPVVLNNGVLAYDANGKTSGQILYNTMTTPKGRQFKLMLPDGTKVWLNAASSIRYPTVFSGRERTVEISGEAYFEVVKNINMPFKVAIDAATTVEVLGTHFNINSYKNEPSVKTTLLEGKVRVVNRQSSIVNREPVILKPGQQAVATHDSRMTIHDNVDIDKVMAWKNGFFNFEDASLDEVMKQLERWYDINVLYEAGIPDIRFGGEISRNMNLADVLDVLKGARVRFRMEEGRKLIVTR